MIMDHNQALHWLKNKQKQTNKQNLLVMNSIYMHLRLCLMLQYFFINFIDRKYQKYNMYGSY